MSNSAFTVTGSATGTGTVTAVGATSTDLTITGSPITTSGTFAFTLNTVGVAKGGTGLITMTPYAVLCGGTTATGAMQNVAGVGTLNQVLTSNGAGALPTWEDPTTGGQVDTGNANDLGYYQTTGDTISPLASAINSTLVTDAAGVPSLSQTLPAAVQTNITAVGILTGGSLSAGFTPVPPTIGGTGLSTYTQGDLLYASGANVLSKLAKDINVTRYLSNQGVTNNPSWSQVNLSNGVTNNLPVTNLNGGAGANAGTFWCGNGTWAVPGGGGGTGAAAYFRGDTNGNLTQAFNVSSLSTSFGVCTANFTVAFSGASFPNFTGAEFTPGGTTGNTRIFNSNQLSSASQWTVSCVAASTGSLQHPNYWNGVFFGV